MSSKKAAVCVNIFASLDYIEIVKLEDKRGEIEKAASLPALFDPTTRQIKDPEQMSRVIRDLYDANRIPLNTPTYLVIPSLFTREIDLPSEFNGDELRFALTSEAERFFIFKKNEPQVAWIKLNEATVLYSAFPKTEVDKFIEIFQSHRIPVVAIELSYLAILRGLVATGALSDEIQSGEKWVYMVISDSTFFTAICEGVNLVKTMEAPLSVGASEEMATISEIRQDFERFTSQELLTKLVVVNNATNIDGQLLVSRLMFQGQVVVIEQNGQTLRSRGSMEGIFPCTLEAIGGVFTSALPELSSMNFAPETSNDVMVIAQLQSMTLKGLWIANGVALLLGLLVWGVLSLLVWGKENEIRSLSQNLPNLESKSSFSEVKQKLFIKNAVAQNVKVNDLLVRLGANIPDETWLNKINMEQLSTPEKQVISIEGQALNENPVNQFVNDIQKALQRDDLEIEKIERVENPETQSHFFNWVIRNKKNEAEQAQNGKPPAPGVPQ